MTKETSHDKRRPRQEHKSRKPHLGIYPHLRKFKYHSAVKKDIPETYEGELRGFRGARIIKWIPPLKVESIDGDKTNPKIHIA